MKSFTSTKEHFLQTQLEIVKAQNVRLNQENDLLRGKLKRLMAEENARNVGHVEAKLKAFKLEEERDRMYENLEKIKRKYNQLYEAYLEKVKRCKALEDVFQRQKTLNGLVMKSTLEYQQKDKELKAESPNEKESELEKLKTALTEAYDIIDELEFELESVDFLEVENQRLQSELNAYKKAKLKSHHEERETAAVSYDEQSEYRQDYDSNASSLADSLMVDLDPAVIERSALTESLVKMAESESNCLRRELLRSRLKKAPRPPPRPLSSEA